MHIFYKTIILFVLIISLNFISNLYLIKYKNKIFKNFCKKIIYQKIIKICLIKIYTMINFFIKNIR